MRLSIFARFIISYLLLFSMLAGVSLYSIYQLSQFNQITRSIILNDTLILEYSNQLSDILLSGFRYDRKFVVLNDEALYENYLLAKNEFNVLLNKALAKTTSEEIKNYFHTIGEQHENFGRLVNVERELIRIAKSYPFERYAAEKKEIVDNIIEQLKKIRDSGDRNVFTKIVNLSESSDKTKNVSLLISILALSTGLTVAFIITRSIKKPLDMIRAKTIEISQGNFSGNLEITTPPVIAQLATAINTMCHRLQEVDNVKTDFFSHMSHELRTPLASIQEGTKMLLEGLGGEISEKQEHILNIIVQESDRLIDQINSLLDLSKMEAGMLKYKFMRTDLSTLAKQSLEALAPLAEAKNIAIDNRIGALQPVKVDRERVLQVFRNIIGNAIKFTPENGKIILEANVREPFVDYSSIIGDDINFAPANGTDKPKVRTSGSFVEVAVHDTGIGIAKEDLARIFLKFQQVLPKGVNRTKGTGLGLATVKQIILAHGGKVWVTSQVGQGTTFYITLPLAA